MNIILQKAVQKKIIHPLDFYFSQFIDLYNPAIMLAAACISYENRKGNIFLDIQYFEKNYFFYDIHFSKKIRNFFKKKPNWYSEFTKSHAFSDGSSFAPLVFYKNKIYLYKIWKSEKNIINFLYQNQFSIIKNTQKHIKILDELFPCHSQNDQKIVTAIALIRKITFILGKPGTGKTTIILKLIIALIKTSDIKINIKLATPTGKSANRLTSVLKQNTIHSFLNKKEQEHVPNSAITIHKLLQIQEISQISIFNKNNPLNIDVLIIDESSMINILMMENIFNVVSKNTKIIFIGDHNQLSPIETGSILKNISYYSKDGYSKDTINVLKKIIKNYNFTNTNKKKTAFISDNICILKKNYRFKKNSNIDIVANGILNNDKKIINDIFSNSMKHIYFFNITNYIQYIEMIQNIVGKYEKYWKSIYSQENISSIIKNFNNYQVLCLTYKNLFGVHDVNKILENIMYKNKNIKYFNIKNQKWYIGKPIIITKNNKYLGLSNGDIGVSNIDKKGVLQVCFLTENNKIKKIPAYTLENYETAWAITVHKAQGSEFNNTILILPNSHNNFFCKDILYTGITRSRKNVYIYTKKEVFLKILSRNLKNTNSLSDYI